MTQASPRPPSTRSWRISCRLLTGGLRDRYGIDPKHPGRAIATAAVGFKAKGDEIFGSSFEYVQDRLDTEHSWVNISRCYFNDFFRRHDHPELVRFFCGRDIPFTDELSKPAYGLRFERPTAMGLEDDVCRFQFTRTAAADPDTDEQADP